jgi:hypothetical protein
LGYWLLADKELDSDMRAELAIVTSADLMYEHLRCGLGDASEPPALQGSVRRAESAGSQPFVHQPDQFWLWRVRLERLIRPLAQLPSVWNESASGPQRRQEQRAAQPEPSGSRGVGCGGESSLSFGECQWRVDYAATNSSFGCATYVDEVVKVRFLGGLDVLRRIYPSC